MDFFERQERAHRNTRLLVVYFVAGVMTLIGSIYLVSALIFSGVDSRHRQSNESQPRLTLWNPQLFFGVAVGTLAVIAIGSVFKTVELSQGGSAVANMLGGRLVNSNTNDPDERKLLNVVEEMALASGLPVPPVYVLDEEEGINAFAAGHSSSDAVVSVTRGCMKLLTRDELQGVIGHEFSHILNGDMRLNLRLLGIIFGIICLAVIGRILLQVRSRGKEKNVLPLLGLALIVIGWIGVFFGRLIQAAVSRQREFLADASAVQFTRNPDGLAGALKKIGGLGVGSRLEAAHAGEASHMFFGNGMGEPLFGLLATHPPLEERIRAIDPNFDGQLAPVSPAEGEATIPPVPAVTPRSPISFPGGAGLASGLAQTAVAAQSVLPGLGAPGTMHLRYAVELRDSFPTAVREAARDALGASSLVYSLLISPESEMRNRQLALLSENGSEGIRQETERLLPHIAPIAARARLPLVDLALPALRQLSPAQYQQFSRVIQQLMESDNQIDLFEYVLQKITLRHLDSQFNRVRPAVVQYYSAGPLVEDCSDLLSAVARAGTESPEGAQAAFQRGAQLFGHQAQSSLNFVPPESCSLANIDAALDRLALAAPQIKKNVINACAQVVAADGVIQENEAELLRAIADTLDCPIPPFVQPDLAGGTPAKTGS